MLSIFGLVIGSLIQAQWFGDQEWTFSTGLAGNLGLGHLIAAGFIVAVSALNLFGIRPAVWLSYVTGALLMVPLGVFIVLPYLTGEWTGANMTWELGGAGQAWDGWQLAIVWLYLMGWSSYGVEACATFTPEYRDTVRDSSRALRTSAVFSLGVYALLPLGVSGTAGQKAAADDPVAFYVPAFERILGGSSDLVVALLVASLILSMNVALADSSRALYGIAGDRMTIRQLFRLNRHGVPARAIAVDAILNVCLLFLIGNTLAILVAGNLGYLLAHFFALTGFLLLRRDRPAWPRPIKLGPAWVWVAGALAAVNALIIAVGATNPQLTGYGGTREALIGLAVLGVSVVLFVLRRRFQDREPITLRERSPVETELEPSGA